MPFSCVLSNLWNFDYEGHKKIFGCRSITLFFGKCHQIQMTLPHEIEKREQECPPVSRQMRQQGEKKISMGITL